MVGGLFPSCRSIGPCQGWSLGIIITGRKTSPVRTVWPTYPCICQKSLFRAGNWIKLRWCNVPETSITTLLTVALLTAVVVLFGLSAWGCLWRCWAWCVCELVQLARYRFGSRIRTEDCNSVQAWAAPERFFGVQ